MVSINGLGKLKIVFKGPVPPQMATLVSLPITASVPKFMSPSSTSMKTNSYFPLFQKTFYSLHFPYKNCKIAIFFSPFLTTLKILFISLIIVSGCIYTSLTSLKKVRLSKITK